MAATYKKYCNCSYILCHGAFLPCAYLVADGVYAIVVKFCTMWDDSCVKGMEIGWYLIGLGASQR